MRYLVSAVLAAIVACRPPAPPVPATPEGGPSTSGARPATDSVVTFMQGMIDHHAQALRMSALVPQRAARPEIRLLAERIGVSQRDEIAQMRRWLLARGQSVPARDAHAHAAMGHGHLMPGMLTQPQLDSLAAATGSGFDRLFLQGMIRHHEGALTMVAALLASRRNLDAETFRIVSEIDADQRAEIQRMQSLLRSMP
jgi:uncharacterized protein (DUF305 family)